VLTKKSRRNASTSQIVLIKAHALPPNPVPAPRTTAPCHGGYRTGISKITVEVIRYTQLHNLSYYHAVLYQDCEETFLTCGGEKCSCLDMAQVNDWESRGTCGIPLIIEQHGQGSTKSGGSINQADKTRNTGKLCCVASFPGHVLRCRL
jgi:hypothetical protein